MTAYLLLLLDLVVVALLLTVVGYLVVAVLSRVFRRSRRRPPLDNAHTTWRRCESCKHRWEGAPGDEPSALTLRVRRAARRRARKRQRTLEWARPQGWSRCPSCLSRQVRDSRRQTAR